MEIADTLENNQNTNPWILLKRKNLDENFKFGVKLKSSVMITK